MNNYELQWRFALPVELLNPQQVHVWRADLDVAKSEMEKLLEILSPDEIDRAGRFHFEIDKKRYVTARGILRRILGGYLGKDPSTLKFQYTIKGKPMLATNLDHNAIHFNLSYSKSLALFAFTLNRNIGIDIELLSDKVAIVEIARRFFSQAEISSLEMIHKNRVHELFFQYWTRKEAFLKAIGEGISYPMEKVDVSLINGNVLLPIAFPGEESESNRWFLQDLFPGSGYVAAISVEGGDCKFSYLNYSLLGNG